MRLLGTMLPAILLAGIPTAAALAQDASSAGGTGAAAPSTGSTTGTPATTAPVDINQPIGATAPPDINQPIGAGPKADINQPIGTNPDAAAAAQPEGGATPPAGAPEAPVMAGGVEVPAVGASAGYGSPLFSVDSRANLANTGGAFFGGLPIPALGYKLSASLVSQYQSNLLHLNSATPVPTGASRSDFSFSPLVSGSANLPFGRQQIYFSGLVGRDFYVRNTNYDRGRYSLAGGANFAFASSCTANVDGNWLQAQSSQSSRAGFVPNTLSTTSFGASAGCAPPTGFQPSVSYRYSQARNSSPNPDFAAFKGFNNLNNNNVVLTLGYSRPSLGKVALFGSKSFNVYPNRPVDPATNQPPGVNVTNIGGSYERSLGTRLYFDGSLFWVHNVPSAFDQSASSSLGYSLNVNYRPSPRIGISVNGSSNSSASPSSNSLYFTSRTFGAQFNYKLTPAFNLGLSAATSYQKYSGGILIIPGQLESDRVNNFRASLAWYSPSRHFNASVYILQQNQNGTTTAGTPLIDQNRFDYNNTVAGVALNFNM